MSSSMPEANPSPGRKRSALLAVAAMLACLILCATAPTSADDEGDEDIIVPDGPALEWVDAAGRDTAKLDEAIESLRQTLYSEDGSVPFFVLTLGEKVAVYGPAALRSVAVELLEQVPQARGADTRQTAVVHLKRAPDARTFEFVEGGDGFGDVTRRGTELTIRGTPPEIEATIAFLEEQGVLGDPNMPWCETVRLYYLRNPLVVRAILEQMPDSIIQDVSILGGEEAGGPATLVLAGPRAQVGNVKRIIATLDVPQPEVRLDIWAFQISGDKPDDVERRARIAQQRVDAIGRLVRGYLRQLEGHAQQIQMANVRYTGRVSAAEVEAGIEMVDKPAVLPGQIVTSTSSGLVLTPSARGRHPLSLTETLATLITVPPEVDAQPVQSPQTDDVTSGAQARVAKSDTKLAPVPVGAMVSEAVTSSALWGALAPPSTIAHASGLKSGSRLQTLSGGLATRFGRWIAELQQTDPEALAVWAELAGKDPEATLELRQLLDRASRAADRADARGRGIAYEARALLPRRLLDTFRDEDYSRTAEEVIANFLWMHTKLAQDWDAAPPEHIRMRSADAKTVLENAERALAGDVRRLLLAPLQNELRALASAGGESGLGSAGSTSIAVLSGTEAEVVGSAVSYFNISRPKRLDTEALQRSEEFSRALEGFLPARRGKSPSRVVVRVILDGRPGVDTEEWVSRLGAALSGIDCWAVENASPPEIMIIGTRRQVASAVDILRTGGVVSGIQSAGATAESAPVLAENTTELAASTAIESLTGLPTDRLLALAMDLGQEEEVWTALTEGARLTFTPYILPGGSAAELAIDFEITHNDVGSETSAPMNAPLSRVARHSARTSVYVQALDLFSLSSLTLSTSHPRPDTAIPILGQIPILGKMFRFPRSPAKVYHESVLMVYSTILPTGVDLAATLDVEPAGQ